MLVLFLTAGELCPPVQCMCIECVCVFVCVLYPDMVWCVCVHVSFTANFEMKTYIKC